MRTYKQALDWTDKREWAWPDADKKLVLVFEHVADIDYFIGFVDNRRVCIQAGGACGVFALRYSQLFDRVYTFEPEPVNFECLASNVTFDNVFAYNAPLAGDSEKYSIRNDVRYLENYGAGYCGRDDNGLRAMRIDDLKLDACDLIQLDIEGFELQALQGGEETILKYKPVIILEEKRLNHMPFEQVLKSRQWLESLGYKEVGRLHWDVVFKC